MISALRRRTQAAERHILYFDVTLSLVTPKPSGWRALMLPAVGGSARVESPGARPSRGVVKRPLRHLDLTITVVWFWDLVDRVRGFIW